MPRAKNVIRKRAVAGIDQASISLVDDCLRFGVCVLGEPMYEGLRTMAEWRSAWEARGSVLLPEHLASRPGSRPFAHYVLGIVPPLQADELPAAYGGLMAVPVADDSGQTKEVWRHWRPFHGCEGEHLYRAGIIDRAELVEHRRARGRGVPCC
jgi:hypothetical protein